MNKMIIYGIVAVICVGLVVYLLRDIFGTKEETKTVYCGPDETLPAIVFRNPTQAFPVFAAEYQSKVTGNISVMDSLRQLTGSGAGSLELDKTVVELRDKLTNESSRMEMLMKSNFFAYNSKPCDTAISRQYFEFLSVMAEKNSELEKLKASLTKATQKGGDDPQQLVVVKDTATIRQAIRNFRSVYAFQK